LDQAPTGGGTRLKSVFLDQVRVDMKKKGREVGRVEDGESPCCCGKVGWIRDPAGSTRGKGLLRY
jgi:hypothetical protein